MKSFDPRQLMRDMFAVAVERTTGAACSPALARRPKERDCLSRMRLRDVTSEFHTDRATAHN